MYDPMAKIEEKYRQSLVDLEHRYRLDIDKLRVDHESDILEINAYAKIHGEMPNLEEIRTLHGGYYFALDDIKDIYIMYKAEAECNYNRRKHEVAQIHKNRLEKQNNEPHWYIAKLLEQHANQKVIKK